MSDPGAGGFGPRTVEFYFDAAGEQLFGEIADRVPGIEQRLPPRIHVRDQLRHCRHLGEREDEICGREVGRDVLFGVVDHDRIPGRRPPLFDGPRFRSVLSHVGNVALPVVARDDAEDPHGSAGFRRSRPAHRIFSSMAATD